MPDERLAFTKRAGDLAVEVKEWKEGEQTKRRIDLLRSYEKDGTWYVTNHLGHGNHHRGALLLKAAKDWIKEQDKAEGEKREAERRAKEPRSYSGQKAGARFRERAREESKVAGMGR
jgi:hypothetical protein